MNKFSWRYDDRNIVNRVRQTEGRTDGRRDRRPFLEPLGGSKNLQGHIHPILVITEPGHIFGPDDTRPSTLTIPIYSPPYNGWPSIHSRALAHSRAPLLTQPCPHCSHSRAPGEQWARLCVFTLQGCVQAARLCRGSPVPMYSLKWNDCVQIYNEILLFWSCFGVLYNRPSTRA